MKGKLLSFVVVFVLLITQASFAKQPTLRIKFDAGATSAKVRGRLRNFKDEARYVVRVRAGQHMEVEATGKEGPAAVAIESPSGSDAAMDRDMSGSRASADPTEAGDYKIIVTENRKGDPWSGTFVLKITVR